MQDRNKRHVGAEYEALAAQYLERKGYQILARNYRSPHGEIDIIARMGDVIVFCEIKYRANMRYGDPLEAVDVRKQRRISRVALYYCAGPKALPNVSYRFDVIGIYGDGRVEQIENAFYFQR